MATPSRASGSPRPHGRRSAGSGDTTDLREAILAATAELLAESGIDADAIATAARGLLA